MRAKVITYESKLLKADEEAGEGQAHLGRVHALVSTWDVIDHDGDRMIQGAFRDTLTKWRDSGDPIPFIWSHRWDDPAAHVGWCPPEMARETDRGLEVSAYLNLDDPPARKIYELMKQRRVRQFSFAYDVLESKETDEDTERGLLGKVVELNKVDLFECGPCLLGSNSETDLLEVAARRSLKYGRAVSTSNRGKLADAQQLIQDVIDSDDVPDTDARRAEVKETPAPPTPAPGEPMPEPEPEPEPPPDEYAQIVELVGGL